jgi:hypothetical protein
VPEAQVLDSSAAGPLTKAAEGDPYELRLRDLRLAKPWMEMLTSGTRLVIDFAEWINKSSGRGTISVGVDHEDGNDPEELVTWHVLVGPSSYAEAVPKLFAWGDVDVHQETYDYAEHDQYHADLRRLGARACGAGHPPLQQRRRRSGLLPARTDAQRARQGVPGGRQIRHGR